MTNENPLFDSALAPTADTGTGREKLSLIETQRAYPNGYWVGGNPGDPGAQFIGPILDPQGRPTGSVRVYQRNADGSYSGSNSAAGFFMGEDPAAPKGSTGGFGESNLQELLAQPGVIGHEFIGNQLLVHLANGRADVYRDTDGDGGFSYGSNIGSSPGPDFVPLGRTNQDLKTAPGLASMTNNLFSPSSTGGLLESRLDYFGGTPDTPLSEGEALTNVSRASNPQMFDTGNYGTAMQRDPFGNMSKVSDESVARLRLQGQQPDPGLMMYGNQVGSRDQQVLRGFGLGGINAYDDPLQASALAQQLHGLQVKYQQDLGLDPLAALQMAKNTYGA